MKTKAKRVPTMPAREGRGLDWSNAQRVAFHDLKPSTETISRQSLIKVVLAEHFAAAKS